MKKAFLSTSLLFLTFRLFAQQPGYVITNNNDTIKCKVWSSFFSKVKYQLNDKSDPVKITTENIKEYQLSKDSSIYRFEILKEGAKPVFIQVLERGTICLYVQYTYNYTSNYTSTTTTNWYVNKNNGALINLKTDGLFVLGASHNDRKNELADMFSDVPDVLAAYKNDNSFSFKTIRKHIHQYNLETAHK